MNSKGAIIISCLVILGFYSLTYFILFEDIITKYENVLFMLVGAFSTAFANVMQYWIGSSKGSKDKDFALSGLAKQDKTKHQVTLK